MCQDQNRGKRQYGNRLSIYKNKEDQDEYKAKDSVQD